VSSVSTLFAGSFALISDGFRCSFAAASIDSSLSTGYCRSVFRLFPHPSATSSRAICCLLAIVIPLSRLKFAASFALVSGFFRRCFPHERARRQSEESNRKSRAHARVPGGEGLRRGLNQTPRGFKPGPMTLIPRPCV